MFKRFGRISALVVLLCIVLAGGVAAKEVTLRYMTWGQPIILASMRESIAEFEVANPGIKVELILPPSGTDYYGKLDAYIAGRQMPDVVRLEWEDVMRYASAGALMDLGKFGPDSDDFVDAMKTAVTYKDKLYGLPWHTDTIGIFYNKTLVEAAGIQVPTSIDEAWTWEELTEATKQAQAHGAKWGLAFGDKTQFVRSAIYQNGASLYTADGSKPNVNTPEFEGAIDWILELHRSGVSPAAGWQEIESASDMFKVGDVAFLVDGSWMLRHFHDTIDTFDLGVTYIFRGKEQAQPFGGSLIGIAGTTKHAKEAYAFADFLTSKAGGTKIAQDINFLPVRKSLVEEGVEYPQHKEAMKLFGEGLMTVPDILVNEQLHPAHSQTLSILEDVLNVAVAEQWDAAKTCAKIDSEMTDVMKRVRR